MVCLHPRQIRELNYSSAVPAAEQQLSMDALEMRMRAYVYGSKLSAVCNMGVYLLPPHLPTYVPAYLHTYLPTTFLPTYLPTDVGRGGGR
jgi:hypothetical protein